MLLLVNFSLNKIKEPAGRYPLKYASFGVDWTIHVTCFQVIKAIYRVTKS